MQGFLTEQGVPTTTAYARANNKSGGHHNAKIHRWGEQTIQHILEKAEYAGHTVNFRTHTKSYKNRVNNPKSEWLVFENTHEAIVPQQDFDLAQELRSNKRKTQKCGEVNPFSGMVYCADCGKKMYLCRAKSLNADQEHLKCSSYAADKDECTAHFIRTAVLKEIAIGEINKVLGEVNLNEEKFIQSATEMSTSHQSAELKKEKKTLGISKKRITELDRLFTRLYEDNVSEKVSDERFEQLSKGYDDEQKKLKTFITELTVFIEKTEQKTADTTEFIRIVKKYERITELTPELMHELI